MKYPGKMTAEVLKTLVKPPVTVKYPYERTEIPKDFRGKIMFDPNLCIGCQMCVRDCPSKAIEIHKVGEEKVFNAHFYLDRCLYCAQCVDSCPKNALASSTQFELAGYDRDKLQETQQ